MDPISHCMMGGLAAKTAKTSPKRFWIMTALGGVPDLDFVIQWLFPAAYYFHHRGLTHSLLGVVVTALLSAWAFSKIDPGPFRTRSLHYFLPLVLHTVFDLLTGYGVQVLSPFSLKLYSWDLIGSINLLPMAVMLFGLMWMVGKDRQGWRHAGLIWGVWIFYIGFVGSGKALAAHYSGGAVAGRSVLPTIYNPLEWRVVRMDSDTHTYKKYKVDLIHGKAEYTGELAMPNGDFPIEASRTSPRIQSFLRNNRWPVVRCEKSAMGWNVEWGILAFSSLGEVAGKIRIQLDEDGRILNERSAYSFWTPHP